MAKVLPHEMNVGRGVGQYSILPYQTFIEQWGSARLGSLNSLTDPESSCSFGFSIPFGWGPSL